MHASRSRAREVLACLALCGVVSACGPREFEGRVSQAKDEQQRRYDGRFPYRPPTEVEKIERLIEFVRKSDGVYYRRDRELAPGLAASWMERRYFTRWGRQIRTASRFVGIVSERPFGSSRPFIFRSSDGDETLVRTLLFDELQRLESTQGRVVNAIMDPRDLPPAPLRQSGKPPTHPIEKAIELVESAPGDVRFVITDRKGVERAEAGPDFASYLRSKTKWLAADIGDVEQWIDEVATRDFISYEPLYVDAGAEARVSLDVWLRDARATAADPQPEVARP